MSSAEWLGYTPMTADAEAWLTRLWRQHALPDEPSFTHWSLEYAREVFELINSMTKAQVVMEDMIRLLASMDVWSADQRDQQWTPDTWTPPLVGDPS